MHSCHFGVLFFSGRVISSFQLITLIFLPALFRNVRTNSSIKANSPLYWSACPYSEYCCGCSTSSSF